MSRVDYRRKAVLARIGETLDRFYMGQEIDWDYDIRMIIDQILDLALQELEFGQGKAIDRGLIIVRDPTGQRLEVGGGFKTQDDQGFSHTIVERTLEEGVPVLYENARSDPSFESIESLKDLPVLSLISVPIRSESEALGVIYIERHDAKHLFNAEDQAFVQEFAVTIAPYIKTALLHQKHVQEISELKAAVEQGATMPNLIGRSDAMKKALDLARVAASVEKTVLITGESGSGKEVLAQAIHQRSRRKEGPFIVVDCSALSENLLESELFGHKRGSFTGAVSDKAGAFEEASGGTLFLDEICDSSMALQQKLRRVLQEEHIRRVGENTLREVDVRVICATNRDLQEEVQAKRFIHDLYHRIHQFPIQIPPLRERKEDIPLLVDHFIASTGSKKNPPVRGIEPAALRVLLERDWRANNIRELKNVVGLAVDLADRDLVERGTIERTLEIRGDAPEEATEPARFIRTGVANECLALDPERTRKLFEDTPEDAAKEERPYYRVQREFSGKLIVESLRYTQWKLRPAARLLGVSPVKLRQDFRHYLELLFDSTEDEAQVAQALDMPAETLRRKLSDLGIEVGTSDATSEGAA